jgi:hypothetical protein
MKTLTAITSSIIVSLSLAACSPPGTTTNTSAQSTVSSQTGQLQVEDYRQLAQDAYVYGLQQVIFYQTRYNYTQNETTEVFEGTNSWNLVNDGDPIDTSFKAIVTPNATTAYAIGFLDLQKEPVVLEMPAVADRYFALQVMDAYGIFHLYAGNQMNGTDAQSYVFVPADYQGDIPDDFPATNIIKTPSKTLTGIVRYARTHEEDPKEVDHIKGLLNESTITPLGAWIENGHKGVSKAEQPKVKGDYKTFSRMSELTAQQVESQTAEDFFNFMQLVLNDESITPIADSILEAQMLERLAAIGIAKGQNFNFASLDDTTNQALTEGFEAGRVSVKMAGKENLINMNGWGVLRQSGSFATNWMDRAIMADFGWLGPDSTVSHGAAFAFTDSEGAPLNGSKKYTITFDMNDLPPVSEFWELPMYDTEGYFIDNEIGRYSINSFQVDNGLLHVEEGKLVIYLQTDKPTDANQAKNWLPTPAEGFRMTPRFYGPSTSLINGTYNMPSVIEVK